MPPWLTEAAYGRFPRDAIPFFLDNTQMFFSSNGGGDV